MRTADTLVKDVNAQTVPAVNEAVRDAGKLARAWLADRAGGERACMRPRRSSATSARRRARDERGHRRRAAAARPREDVRRRQKLVAGVGDAVPDASSSAIGSRDPGGVDAAPALRDLATTERYRSHRSGARRPEETVMAQRARKTHPSCSCSPGRRLGMRPEPAGSLLRSHPDRRLPASAAAPAGARAPWSASARGDPRVH